MTKKVSKHTVVAGSVWHLRGIATVKIVVLSVSDTSVRFVRPIEHDERRMFTELEPRTFVQWYVWVSDRLRPKHFLNLDLGPILTDEIWTLKRRSDTQVQVLEVSDGMVQHKGVGDSPDLLPNHLDIWMFRHRYRRGA